MPQEQPVGGVHMLRGQDGAKPAPLARLQDAVLLQSLRLKGPRCALGRSTQLRMPHQRAGAIGARRWLTGHRVRSLREQTALQLICLRHPLTLLPDRRRLW